MGYAGSINIPSQPLAQALNEWAQQTRLELIVQPALVTGKTAPVISGNMTPRQALDRLLAGSGLVAMMDGSTVMIKTTATAGTQQLPEMLVRADSLKQGTAEEGYRVSNVRGVGLWDERSLRDTPYSMSIVPSDLIENVNAQNMGQIFKMNPLTQEPLIQNLFAVPPVVIRGLSSVNSVYDDIPMANAGGSAGSVTEIDRVEIFSGTPDFLYGGGRVGGAINYVTKSPTDVPLRRLTFGNYGGTQFYGHADIGGKFGDQGRFGYRANLLYQGGDTAIGEPVSQKVANIVLDGHLTDTLYADIKYIYNDYSKEATQHSFNNMRERTAIDTSWPSERQPSNIYHCKCLLGMTQSGNNANVFQSFLKNNMLLKQLYHRKTVITETAHRYGAPDQGIWFRGMGRRAAGKRGGFLVDFPQSYDLFAQRLPLAEALSKLLDRKVEVIPEHELNWHIRQQV